MFIKLKPASARKLLSVKLVVLAALVATGAVSVLNSLATIKRRRAEVRLARALPTLEAAAKLYLEKNAEDAKPAKKG